MTKRDITMDEIVEGMAREISRVNNQPYAALARAALTHLLTTANIAPEQLLALVNGDAVVAPKEHPETGDWFYLGDDTESDRCRFSVLEVIDDDVRGDGVFPISRAKELPQVFAAVHYLSEEERALRDDDEVEVHSVHNTKEEAEAAYAAMLAALKARP